MRILRALIQISPYIMLIHATNAAADIQESSSCVLNGNVRHLELRSDSPNSAPCQVVYVRNSEQLDDKVLWIANHDAKYCKTQYDKFLVKLETKLKWSCTAEVIDGSASSDPARLETKPQAALPATSFDNSSRESLTVAPEPKPLTRDAMQFFFPSGFYRLDSTTSLASDTGNCPASGYFVWNTRDPSKPVFELGVKLEFELNIADLESSAETPIITLPMESSDGADLCTTYVSFSACQYPDFRLGTENWQTNNESFDCSDTSTTADKRYVSFALFQNREQVPDTETCPAQDQVIHIALAALSQEAQRAAPQRTDTIELVMSTGKELNRNRCRYVRSVAQ